MRAPFNPRAIHAFNPGPITGDGNWTWLLPGRVPTLVDAGTGDGRHLAAVETALGGARLAQVLVTHAHVDHASGVTALAERFGVQRFLKMRWPERDPQWPVPWRDLHDETLIDAGDSTLTAVHTPGHSPDHLCFWHAETRTLFGGDLAIKGSTVWIPARLQGDLSAYLASLQRVIALNPARVLPAHGPIIDEPLPLLRYYLEHRRQREAQIIDALRVGAASVEAIVTRIYPALNPSALPLAAESVHAHLLKLERDGTARRDGEAWHIIDA